MRWYVLKGTSKLMWGLVLLLVVGLSACSQQKVQPAQDEPSPGVAASGAQVSFKVYPTYRDYPEKITAYLTVKGEGKTYYSVVQEDVLNLSPGRYTVTEAEGYRGSPFNTLYKLRAPGPSFSVYAGQRKEVAVYMVPDCFSPFDCPPYLRSDQD